MQNDKWATLNYILYRMYYLFCKIICKLRSLGFPVQDILFIPAYYYLSVGKKLNVRNPQTFTEKMQWLKLYDHKSLYHKLVDKAEVKEYVKNIIGNEYIIPTLGVWEAFDEIDFDSLPDKFVLKSTNGGGSNGVVVCKDKASFDKINAKALLERSMSYDIYKKMGEWVYKGIQPRIIAEELLELPDESSINDYKIWCFNGEPKVLFYASERFNEEKHPPYFDYYDMDLNKLPVRSKGHMSSKTQLKRFPEFEIMKELAKKLSIGYPYIRVDFYCVNSRVYFGELTFYHDAGLVPFEPEEWNVRFGNMIVLPTNNVNDAE